MNEKGKGKGQAGVPHAGAPVKKEEGSEIQLPSLQPTCGICMEPFQATHSPVAAARSANSSSRLQFGTHLPCPSSHGYCISCLNGYINSKLDPDGTGIASQSTVVFPIRCPECPIAEWPEGISDALAERVLSEKGMTLWVSCESPLDNPQLANRNTYSSSYSTTRSSLIAYLGTTAPTRAVRR